MQLVFACAIGIGLTAINTLLGVIVLLVAACVVWSRYRARCVDSYTITNVNLQTTKPPADQAVLTTDLRNVHGVSVQQGTLERILKVGTVTIESSLYHSADSKIVWRHVPNPDKVRDEILRRKAGLGAA